MSELNLHRSVAQFLDWMLLPPAMWTTFPAGWTAMNKGAAGRLRECGLKAGMPDILIFYSGRAIGIELKTGANKPTPAQMNMFHRLGHAGVYVSTCYTVDEVYQTLARFNIPLRRFNYESFKAPESSRPQEPPQGEGRAAT